MVRVAVQGTAAITEWWMLDADYRKIGVAEILITPDVHEYASGG